MADLLFLGPGASEGNEAGTAADAIADALGASGRHRVERLWPLPPHAKDLVRECDLPVYHVGNDVGLHGEVYGLAARYAGLVVLHEVSLDVLGEGLIAEGDPLGVRARRGARLRASDLDDGMPGLPPPLRLPWASHVVQRSRGVAVFTGFARRYLEAAGCRTPVHVLPVPPPASDRRVDRGDGPLVGVFGDLGSDRCLPEVLGALARMDGARLIVAGRPRGGYPVDEVVAASGMAPRVRLLTRTGEEDLLGWVAACDAVVDVRHPERFGSLPFLWAALRAGVPAVVGGETLPDLPDDALVRLGPGRPESDALAGALGTLLGSPGLRREMSERGRALARERAVGAGEAWAGAIDRTLSVVRDPRRRPLSRWASALLDAGADEAAAGRGLGVRYVEALEEMSPAGPAPADPTE